jgi:hypothetical protein
VVHRQEGLDCEVRCRDVERCSERGDDREQLDLAKGSLQPERDHRLVAGLVGIREIAAQPGIGLTAILEARGYEEIEARVASAYEHWVGSEGLSFRGRDDAEQLGDVVKFHWEAVYEDGEAFEVGLNFLVLGADGRIERDYVFVVA